MSQYVYSITVFVVNNEYFMENSKLYDIKTRHNKNLFQPQSNLSKGSTLCRRQDI